MDPLLIESRVPIQSLNGQKKSKNVVLSVIGTAGHTEMIRKEINNLALNHFAENLYDLGDMITSRIDQFETIYSDLLFASNHIPLILCSKSHQGFLIPKFFNKDLLTAIVDKDLRKYNDIAQFDYAHTRILGLQKHYVEIDNYLSFYDKCIRLHEISSDPQKAEVSLRNIDIAFFHLDAIRFSDNIGNEGSGTAGLSIEEACMLAKYAGASTHLKAVVICGYDPDKDVLGMMSKNVALMVYYLLEGLQIKLSEKDNFTENANTYTLIPDNLDSEIVFYENVQSGRWWLEVQNEFSEEPAKVACTKQDYEDACQNKISDRLMKIFAKI